MIQGRLGEKYIRTNCVAKASGKTVTTRSGSVYTLGTIDPAFLKMMQDNNYDFDPENPIKQLEPNQQRTILR